MRDCLDEKIKDLMPDLVAGRLDAARAAVVMAHVNACPSCMSELAVVRAAHAAFPAPRVDVARIVQALPTPVVPLAARRQQGRPRVSWRIAATIATIAVSGVSVAVLQGVLRDKPPRPRATQQQSVKPAEAPEASGLSVGGNLNDLSERQMQMLLDKLDEMDAVPSADPQPAVSGMRAAAGVQ
jgi:anti-sigma factor RsiW